MYRPLIGVLILLTGLLTACGGGSSSDAPASGGAKVFRYNQTGGLSSLDPAFANNRAAIWATSQIYNGLFSFSKTLDPHKELCEEYEISPDGKTYTFTLKQNVHFHDNECFPGGRGREVKAEDAVFSLKRILNTGNGAWVFNDKVLKNPDGSISDTCFKAVGDYRFKIYLNRRFPAFLQILAMPYCFIVAKEAVDKYGADFRKNPVGTGPFMLQKGKWIEKSEMFLAKNQRYWKKDGKGNSLPYLDGIKVSFIEDRNTEFNEFYAGKIDFVANLSEAAREQVLEKNGEVKDKFRGRFKVDKIPYLLTEYIGFQLDGDEKSNPLVNKKLRQALNYAINRKGLISFLRSGMGTPGDYGFIPPALPSFDSTKVRGYSYNQTKAQELLKEAGYPNGNGLPKLKLYTYTSDKDIAEFLKKEWEQIGVKVEIEMNQFVTHQDMVKNGKVGFFRASWIGDYPDAENFLALFYAKNQAPVGPNTTRFRSSPFDKLFEEAHETDNLFTRFEDYLKMDQLVMEESPIIVLYYDEVLQLKQNQIEGLDPDPMNNLTLELVKINPRSEQK